MIRLNLLPYRELKRQADRRRFLITAATALGATLAVCVAVGMALSAMIDRQQARNQFLEARIKELDVKIARIRELKEKKKALLARKAVVETLQDHRAQSVHLMAQLARQTPAGVSLRLVKQVDAKVTLQGMAQSNDRVALLMRNLAHSPMFGTPTLTETKAQANNGPLIEFSMDVKITSPQADGQPAAPAAPGPKGGRHDA